MKQAFLDELTLCWLHASDDVIRSIYSFLETVRDTARPEHKAKKEEAFATFIAELRKDALSGEFIRTTNLTAANYKILKLVTKTVA